MSSTWGVSPRQARRAWSRVVFVGFFLGYECFEYYDYNYRYKYNRAYEGDDYGDVAARFFGVNDDMRFCSRQD